VTYGGDSGNRIFDLYWRCPLIRVSVIRGSTVPVYARTKTMAEMFSVENVPAETRVKCKNL
jgi:hypothetical protein